MIASRGFFVFGMLPLGAAGPNIFHHELENKSRFSWLCFPDRKTKKGDGSGVFWVTSAEQ